MTRRASLLLDALADGPLSRKSIFERMGFALLNNAASELRDAGYPVICTKVDGTYYYEIGALDEDGGLSVSPLNETGPPAAVLVERVVFPVGPDGQLELVA